MLRGSAGTRTAPGETDAPSRIGRLTVPRRLAALSLLALLARPHAAPAERVVRLVSDGRSEYVIVVPDGEDLSGRWSRLGKAARLLQSTLKEAGGVELPIFAEGNAPADIPRIFLGKTRAAAAAGLPVAGLEGWTCVKRVVGRDLFLVGVDRASRVTESPYHAVYGTLRAVASFLQDEVGVRFLLPGPNGVFVPKLAELSVSTALDVTEAPLLDYCTSRPQEITYDAANNYFQAADLYKTYGGHSYYDAVPSKKHSEEHPEYFGYIARVRSPGENHLCLANREVAELMLREMERELDRGHAWVQLAQTDGYKACRCRHCEAMHPEDGERLWILHRELAREMKKRRPGKKIVILSYGPTIEPPTTFSTFPDNVIIELCRYTEEAFEQWRPFASAFVVYVYNWGTYHTLGFAPKRTPTFAGEQVRFFLDNNVRGIYKCGFGENLGLEGPVYYVYGQMLRDPAQDPIRLANDFYRAAYGKARAPMRKLFEKLYERLQLYSDLRLLRRSGKVTRQLMPPSPEDVVSYYFPPKLLLSMESNLRRAKAVAEGPRVKARIRLVEREFLYLKNLASVFYYYHAYRLSPSWTTFDLLANEIEERRGLIDSYYDAKGRMIREDGWPRFFANCPKKDLLQGGRLTGTLSAPFNWNAAALREKELLPGVGKKTMTIRRLASPVSLDGAPDEPAWQSLRAEALAEIGLGDLGEPASFKAAYDDGSFYVSFVCDWSTVGEAELASLGVDGPCWREQCLEIFLDPIGSREHYYHFIFNAAPNSRFDERFGFVDDPIHPMYGKADRSWNGDWEYAVRVDRARQRWTAEVKVPFSVLGVAPPQPGAAWTMNIGREHYEPPDKRGHRNLELSMWSPNLEARSFGALHAFGDVVFE